MNRERGGTLLGFIIGVVVGLASALVVAIYVTKVPVPFLQKAQSRTADQNADEAKKNKDWDPNAGLYGKNPARTAAPATAASAPQDPKVAGKPETKGDVKADAKGEVKPAVSADPLGDLAKTKAAASDAADGAFTYFIQLGAFRTAEDAEAQRAKLSLAGIETKVSAKEQSGKMVHRVRVGPFEKRDEAERAKDKLDKSGYETALVRVQK
ncbi:SPOR domain-containing protein [Curvibacter sp. APW13]|uniref:SPOR domain-containing protein n=1 Tax=Curvibacter sp. APW13 TaxID=3077236 RepID=UPI0028DD918B|nr:SPOR domain-containing protein [Curvibacter sp. APW13]MDT8990834.1 SPOR domain-containing protein [Curvibacter sp. APW13]